mmetsp:Transcript_18754/g.52428  ORF Transcript_18754/g.52428 Transcript_18754/m.52428 type:complete len:86 (-) Transcript_18754:345-602(-)
MLLLGSFVCSCVTPTTIRSENTWQNVWVGTPKILYERLIVVGKDASRGRIEEVAEAVEFAEDGPDLGTGCEDQSTDNGGITEGSL